MDRFRDGEVALPHGGASAVVPARQASRTLRESSGLCAYPIGFNRLQAATIVSTFLLDAFDSGKVRESRGILGFTLYKCSRGGCKPRPHSRDILKQEKE